MRCVCPECGCSGSFTMFMLDKHARECVAISARIPAPVCDVAMDYVTLFRPTGGRGLSWKRALTLMTQLRDLVTTGYVKQPGKGKVDRPCTPAMWHQAIEDMLTRKSLGKLSLPMPNHNYLRAVVYDIANKSDYRAEMTRNRAERNGTFTAEVRQARKAEKAERMTPDEMRAIRQQNQRKRKSGDDSEALGNLLSGVMGRAAARKEARAAAKAKKAKPQKTPADDLREFIRAQMADGAALDAVVARLPSDYQAVWAEIQDEFINEIESAA